MTKPSYWCWNLGLQKEPEGQDNEPDCEPADQPQKYVKSWFQPKKALLLAVSDIQELMCTEEPQDAWFYGAALSRKGFPTAGKVPAQNHFQVHVLLASPGQVQHDDLTKISAPAYNPMLSTII